MEGCGGKFMGFAKLGRPPCMAGREGIEADEANAKGGYPNGAIATGIPPPPPGGCWPTPGMPRLPETWGGGM
jgi:hypothetical protein